MNTKIMQSDLNKRLLSHDGVVKIFSVDLNNCIVSERFIEELHSLKIEMRDLLRSEQNLYEVIELITKLEEEIFHSDPYCLSISNRALFSTAVVLYGACFVRGGRHSKVPLSNFLDKISDKALHDQMMTYRHKLLSHLDEDHDVRTDRLEWELHVQESKLVPIRGHLNGSKVLMEMGTKNLKWIEMIKSLLLEIQSRKDEICVNVNSILSDIEIVI